MRKWLMCLLTCVGISALAANDAAVSPGNVTTPSFSCENPASASIDELICSDVELMALNRKMAEVYAAAAAKSVKQQSAGLTAEQRGWIEGRNNCWQSEATRRCVEAAYVERIAELQARYRLVPHSEPVVFVCDENVANEIIVTFFETDPRTMLAERGDSSSLMFAQPTGSGARYQGPNESFWEHQGEARITWGSAAPEMHCKPN